MVDAAHIASVAASPQRARACASDWKTATVGIPTPPPSASGEGSVGNGAMFAASSRTSSRGESRRPPVEWAARRRPRSTRSSMMAATSGARDNCAPVEPARGGWVGRRGLRHGDSSG